MIHECSNFGENFGVVGNASSGEKHQQGRSPSAQVFDNTIAASDTFPTAKGT